MAINVKVSGGQRISAVVQNSVQQKVSAPTIFIGSTSAGAVANNAAIVANAAYQQANSAYTQANSAYSWANTSIQVTGGEITGNLIVDGTIYGNVYVVDAGTF
jgi:hypothetical protein